MVMGGFGRWLWRRLAGASLLEPPRPPKGPMKLRRLVGEQGTAVVEYALVVPWLFLLLFGIFDFARALNYYNNMTQLAGQGARAAAVSQNPDGSLASGTSIQTQLACRYTTSAEVRRGVHVAISQVPTDTGQPVTVTATYDFHLIPLVNTLPGHPDITLKASSTKLTEVTPTYTAGDVSGSTCP
jgi:Flp pilus assembly protein TadG